MKSLTLIIGLLFILNGYCTTLFPTYDSITNPPTAPLQLTGNTQCCLFDTTTYTVDIPIACTPYWYLNGELIDSVPPPLSIIWNETGSMQLWIIFSCDSTIIYSDTLNIAVNSVPSQPSSIIGYSDVCQYSTTTYTTSIGENETCIWKVDNIIQISDSSSMSYYWPLPGNHIIEVQALNDCGISPSRTLEIVVYEDPVVNLGNDTTIYQGQTIILNAENPGCSYLWSTGDTTQSISVNQTGNYYATAENVCGSDYDDIFVDVIVDIHENIPSIIMTTITNGILFINNPVNNIKTIAIYNLQGQLITKTNAYKPIKLPTSGRYQIVIFTTDNKIFKKSILNI